MKFKALIQLGMGEQIWEEFEHNCTDARVKAQEIVDSFNASLKDYEVPRTLIDVEVLDENNGPEPSEHNWDKTNLVTIIEKGLNYDTAKCTNCGITSKRFGLGDHTRDPRYSGDKFARCDDAQKAMTKAQKRRDRKFRRESR